MNIFNSLDFLPDSLSPTIKTVVYVLVLLHLLAVGVYICTLGPGVWNRKMSKQELMAEMIRQAKEKQE